jgi:glycosyltransferase involved in cell wall biosynthesis
MNITFLLWGGAIGGTERLSLNLAGEMRSRGLSASVVFVADEGKLRDHLVQEALDFRCADLSPGRLVLRHPRVLANTVAETEADVVVVGSFGYLGPVLRLAGYDGAVIGVEHGALLTLPNLPRLKQMIRRTERLIGARLHDAEVEVSDFMLELAKRTHHARRLVRIRHGVKVPEAPVPPPPVADGIRLGYVGRLIPGKGVDVALRALAQLRTTGGENPSPTLTVAGDGPDRPSLETLTRALGLSAQVNFTGWTEDISEFWRTQHISVAASNEFIESFCLTAVEAMANARPSIISDRGALPELVVPNVTGSRVPAGDVQALAGAIDEYARRPELIADRGRHAHRRALEHFTIERCVDEYIALAESLLESPRSRRPSGLRGPR